MTTIFALTEPGLLLAEKLATLLHKKDEAKPTICFKPQPFAEKVQQAFQSGEPLIFICATGIVMRTLAPVLVNKYEDPPVLVLDERGQFVIPLLSGHEGGANEWGRKIALILGAQLVLTTANQYLKPVYMVGMGCERHCPESELRTLLEDCLAKVELDISDVSAITSIDIKADEVGLIDLAYTLHTPYQTWTKNELATVESQLSEKSDYVFSVVGVYGVAESAALYAVQQACSRPAELVLTKQKTAKATCAIARGYMAQ